MANEQFVMMSHNPDGDGHMRLVNGSMSVGTGDANLNFAQSVGVHTYAKGNYSQAYGNSSFSYGESSHAAGENAAATSKCSIALGNNVVSVGLSSVALGGSSLSVTQVSDGVLSLSEGTLETSTNVWTYTVNCTDNEIDAKIICGAILTDNTQTFSVVVLTHSSNKITCKWVRNDANMSSLTEFTVKSISIGSVVASGICSYAEGFYNSANGDMSHAEGTGNIAHGTASHAEGNQTKANGKGSHVEGQGSIADGNCSHAEGMYNAAGERSSHAEGEYCIAAAGHAEGLYCTSVKGHAEGKYTMSLGEASHAEGQGSIAAGAYSHIEGGYDVLAAAHAVSSGGDWNVNTPIGYNMFIITGTGLSADIDPHIRYIRQYGRILFKTDSGAKLGFIVDSHSTSSSPSPINLTGWYTKVDKSSPDNLYDAISETFHIYAYVDAPHAALGKSAHVEGEQCFATGEAGHAEGHLCNGTYSHAQGQSCTASGKYSHAEGLRCQATGGQSHAQGNTCTASDYSCFASGAFCNASNQCSTALGHYNAAMTTGGTSTNTTGTAFVIGKGTASNALSNAFSVAFNGVVKAASTITASTTADYAEFFEWLDGNPDNTDFTGYFVTLEGNKLRVATDKDDYILGVVSGAPFVLGNGDCDVWNGMYLRDKFRRVEYEPAPKIEEVYDEDGNVIGEREVKGEYEGTRPILNPEYDPEKKYISRFDRPEWSPVGMLGVLPVYHDGTAEVNGYVTVNASGIATRCEKSHENSYRVIRRNAEDVVEIVFR